MNEPLSHTDVLGGYVELIDLMPTKNADGAVVDAARVSYGGEVKTIEQDTKLIQYLIAHRHTTPFEHVIFKFRVKAPLVVWWQWVRHRTWSFNAQSGRYTPFKEEFYFPPSWRRQSKTNKQASDPSDVDGQAYLDGALQQVYKQGMTYYQAALDMGVAREEARLFLPGFAMYYTFIATVDAHNLMHFLSLRLHNDAQFEIRQYAVELYKIFKEKMPITAAAFDKRLGTDIDTQLAKQA